MRRNSCTALSRMAPVDIDLLRQDDNSSTEKKSLNKENKMSAHRKSVISISNTDISCLTPTSQIESPTDEPSKRNISFEGQKHNLLVDFQTSPFKSRNPKPTNNYASTRQKFGIKPDLRISVKEHQGELDFSKHAKYVMKLSNLSP